MSFAVYQGRAPEWDVIRRTVLLQKHPAKSNQASNYRLSLPTHDVEAFDRNHERDVITTSGEELSAERRAEGL